MSSSGKRALVLTMVGALLRMTHAGYAVSVTEEPAADPPGKPGQVTTMKVGAGPQGVAEDPGLGYLYVANAEEGTLAVVNTRDSMTKVAVRVGSMPRAVAVNIYTSRAYVANYQDSTVSVIDGITQTVRGTIPVGLNPVGIAVDPEQNKIYVTNSGSNSVSIIDGRSDKVTAEIEVGRRPQGIVVNTALNQVVVANAGSNTLTVLDGVSDAVLRELPAPGEPTALAVSKDGKTLYVTSRGTNELTVVEPEKITRLKVGAQPTAVALDEGNGIVYVASSFDRTVSAVDTVTRQISHSIAVGDEPTALLVSVERHLLYVAVKLRGEVLGFTLTKPERLQPEEEEPEARLERSRLAYLGAPLFILVRKLREAEGYVWATYRTEEVADVSSVVREKGAQAAVDGSIYDEDLFSYGLGTEYLDYDYRWEDGLAQDNEYLLYSANGAILAESDYPSAFNLSRSLSDYVETRGLSYRILTESQSARTSIRRERLPTFNVGYDRVHSEVPEPVARRDQTETTGRFSADKAFGTRSFLGASYERNEFVNDVTGFERVSDDVLLNGSTTIREGMTTNGDVEFYRDKNADVFQTIGKLFYFPQGNFSWELDLERNDRQEQYRSFDSNNVRYSFFRQLAPDWVLTGDSFYYTSNDDFGAAQFSVDSLQGSVGTQYSKRMERAMLRAATRVGGSRVESVTSQDTTSGSLYLGANTLGLRYGTVSGFYNFDGQNVVGGEDWRAHDVGFVFDGSYFNRLSLSTGAHRLMTEFGDTTGVQDFVNARAVLDASDLAWSWGSSRLHFGYVYDWVTGEQTLRRGAGAELRQQQSLLNFLYGDFRLGARPTRRSRFALGARREESFGNELLHPSSSKIEARFGYDLNALDFDVVYYSADYDAGIEPDREVLYFEARRSF